MTGFINVNEIAYIASQRQKGCAILKDTAIY